MAEAKPFASLSSGLLARKGAARPAMRPQGFGQSGHSLEDLGWNDMGFEPPKPVEVPRDETHDAFGEDVVEHPRAHPTGLTPLDSPVHQQQAEIVDRLYEVEDDEQVDPPAEFYEAETETETEAEAETEAEKPADEVRAPVLVSPAPVAAPARARAAAAPGRAPRPRSVPGIKGKAAFTLRLDRERHLKLRLACAVDGRSAQQLVTDALDQLLGRMPELESMAAKAKHKG